MNNKKKSTYIDIGETMLKVFFSFLIIFISIQPIKAIEFSGKSYIVMDSQQKTILKEHNAHYVQSVASISKIMTAIIAIENGKLDDEYVIGEEVNKAWGSGVYIHIGDRINLRDLLHGLLLRSGNDAANVIAVNIAGDIDAFVSKMNQKAQELNMSDTIFSNPTGLDEEDDGNLSSAYDMAILMSYCSQNPIFNDIVSKKTYVREDGGGTWKNKNRLLNEYEYCVGGKTGFTKKARRTLVTRAIKDNVSLVIVTLNCGNDFEFHEKMYEQCFLEYSSYLVLPKGIYQYNGHSFLIDHDLYYSGQEKKEVTFYLDNESVEVYVSQDKIHEVSNIHFASTMIQYFKILLGEFIYG